MPAGLRIPSFLHGSLESKDFLLLASKADRHIQSNAWGSQDSRGKTARGWENKEKRWKLVSDEALSPDGRKKSNSNSAVCLFIYFKVDVIFTSAALAVWISWVPCVLEGETACLLEAGTTYFIGSPQALMFSWLALLQLCPHNQSPALAVPHVSCFSVL